MRPQLIAIVCDWLIGAGEEKNKKNKKNHVLAEEEHINLQDSIELLQDIATIPHSHVSHMVIPAS